MPLVLDIFGVILMQEGVNRPLLEMCAAWRRDGERVYGASNMSVLQHQEFWQQDGIQDAFDDVFCSGQLGVSKPDPVFFTAVAQKIGKLPEELVFFDDRGTNVHAAALCGWEAYIFTDNRDLQSVADGFFLRQRAEETVTNLNDDDAQF